MSKFCETHAKERTTLELIEMHRKHKIGGPILSSRMNLRIESLLKTRTMKGDTESKEYIRLVVLQRNT